MRLAAILLVVLAAPASAERYVVQPGETLEHVADAFGCTTSEVLRANHLNNTLVPARTIVTIPSCTKESRVRTRRAEPRDRVDPAEAKARDALAVIDGKPAPAPSSSPPSKLAHGTALPSGDGYYVRRPDRAFGEPHVISYVRAAIAEVRALYPEVHTLAIGDISAREGGKLASHLSHQTGVDVDLGFYFHAAPSGYPESFVTANKDLDLEATWALLVALARTADHPDGVSMIFLDYDVQARFVRWATANGTPKSDLEMMFQYPRGKDALVGLVRHWPNHADHAHVRFR